MRILSTRTCRRVSSFRETPGIGYDVFMDSIEILIPWASLEATISAVSEAGLSRA